MEASYSNSITYALTHDSRAVWFTFAAIALLSWRVYRFTISPMVWPNDPKEYPYWIPVIGHLKGFFQNSSRLLTQSRLYFNDTREPYALTVAGQKWYILTDPEDVASIYKINDGSLSYDIFTIEVMKMIGVSQDGIDKAFQTQDPGQDDPQCPTYKSLMSLSKELHSKQLTPGKRLGELIDPAISFLSENMNSTSIASRGKDLYATPSADGSVTVSLYDWVGDFFISFGQQAYFGKMLAEIEPDMAKIYMRYDPVAWQVLYQYPNFLCGQMLEAKNSMQAAMERYLLLPVEERGDISWLMSNVEQTMKRLEMSPRDTAIIFFQLYWSISANMRKAPFWMLAYMLQDPTLIGRVRSETAPAISGNDVDLNHLLNHSPTLNSIWEETLRCTAFAASVRHLTTDLTLSVASSPSPVTFRKGARIMMPQRQLHYNTHVFGPNAAEFNAERFIKEPTLARNSSLRAFGGGTTLCPGRHMVKQTTLAFVALAVAKFDVGLDGAQGFPGVEEGNPTLGLVDLKRGSDLKVNLSPRKD